MFSFQGDFKRQRNINLGGRRRNDTARDTAEAVLSKAHEERQRREKERLQHAAALTIQRMWRERHSTAVWRQRMRDRMDMSAVDNPQAPAERLFGSLADFAVHCNGSAQDIDRLHAILLALFLRPADGPRYQRIVAAAAAATQLDGDKWLALALRLFGSALAIPADGVLRVNRDLVIDSLVSAVRADTVVHAGGQPLLRGLVESRGLYAFLSRCLSGDRGLVANVEGAVQLAVAPAGSAALAAAAMPRFVRWILTIPGLPSQIGVRGVTAITRAHIDWIKVARCICDEVAWQQGRQGWHEPGDESPRLGVLASRAPGDAAPQLAAISMLGNMAAFVLPQLSRQGPLTPIDKGFIEACAACVRVVPSGDLLGAKRSSAPAGQARAADAQAQRWLNSVLSVTALGLLVRASCADGPDGDSTHARLAQELLLVFIQRWGKTASSAVINSIFQAVDIRTVGWREVLRDPGFLEHFAGDRARVDAIRAYDLAKLQLLCALLSRQLETIGDDELFQQGMSLPLADIRMVARVCRNIAFALLWSHADSGDLVHLRDSAAALTRQLFALNARHPFVEEDFWLVPPSLLDMASFADKVAEDP
ncbi:ubiquitin-protein ligase (E3), partial [Coemansia biformis]